MIISAGTDGRRYVINLAWKISHFMTYTGPLVLCLLKKVYPQLSYRDFWNILQRILQIRYIRMLILYCVMRWIKYQLVIGCKQTPEEVL